MDDLQSWTQIAPSSAVDGLTTCTASEAATACPYRLLVPFYFFKRQTLTTAQGRERRHTSAESLLQWSRCFSRSVEIIGNPRPAHGRTNGRSSGCYFRRRDNISTTYISCRITPSHIRVCLNITWESKPGAALLLLLFFFLYFYFASV